MAFRPHNINQINAFMKEFIIRLYLPFIYTPNILKYYYFGINVHGGDIAQLKTLDYHIQFGAKIFIGMRGDMQLIRL